MKNLKSRLLLSFWPYFLLQLLSPVQAQTQSREQNYFISARGEIVKVKAEHILHPRCQGSKFHEYFSQNDKCIDNGQYSPYEDVDISREDLNKILHYIKNGRYAFQHPSEALNLRDVAEECQMPSLVDYIDDYLLANPTGWQRELLDDYPILSKLKKTDPEQYYQMIFLHALTSDDFDVALQLLKKKKIKDPQHKILLSENLGFLKLSPKENNTNSLFEFIVKKFTSPTEGKSAKILEYVLTLLQSPHQDKQQNPSLLAHAIAGKNKYLTHLMLQKKFFLQEQDKDFLKNSIYAYSDDQDVKKNHEPISSLLIELSDQGLINKDWSTWSMSQRQEDTTIKSVTLKQTFAPHFGMLFSGFNLSSDARWMAIRPDANTIEIVEVHSQKSLGKIPIPGAMGVAISPDSQTVAITDHENFKLFTLNPIKEIISKKVISYSYEPRFSPDGKKVAYGDNSKVYILDIPTQTIVKEITLNNIAYHVSFSPNGKDLSVSTSANNARVFELENYTVKHTIDHNYHVYSSKFTPNGKYLITGSQDNTAKIYDLETQKVFAHLPNQGTHIYSIDISPSGKYMATATESGRIRIYEIATQKEVVNFDVGSRSTMIKFSPDRKHLFVTSNNDVRMYELNGP